MVQIHTHIYRGRERKTECKNCDKMLTIGESREENIVVIFQSLQLICGFEIFQDKQVGRK